MIKDFLACYAFVLSSIYAVERPNVIYILADDLGYGELGCYGQEKIKTPHIDALAKSGMRFNRHYSGAPVCAPSRGVLLMGRHLSKSYIRNNREHKPEGQAEIADVGMNLASIFQKQDYVTGAFGKWGLGYPGSKSDPNNFGFDYFYGYNCQREAHSFYPSHLWKNDQKIMINEPGIPGHYKGTVKANFNFSQFYGENYAPDLILDEVLGFIERNKEKSFFLYLPFIEPHLAMHPPQQWVDQYPKEWDEPKDFYAAQYLPHRRPRAAYAAMISDLDEHVGKVIEKLDDLDLREKTLVLFSSDNGASHCIEVDHKFFKSGAQLRGLKGSLYEGGLRVPMIASWPGIIKASSQSEHLSGFVDVMPTFCELMQVATPDFCDGVSFLPELMGKKQPKQNLLVWEFQGYGGQQALILDGRWKGVRRELLKQANNVPQWELYDLENDPYEKYNLGSSMPELVARIHQLMLKNRTPNSLFPMYYADK